MRVINVIVTNKLNGIKSIESFGIIDEQQSNEVVEQAEEKFRETIVSIGCKDPLSEKADNLRDEINEVWLDEGYYSLGGANDTKVFLTWSSIDNVQL